MTDASLSHSAMIPVSGSVGQNSEGLHALLAFQQSMSQWMHLQGQQLAVTQQFLQTQERLVMTMLAGGGQVAAALPSLPAPALPEPIVEAPVAAAAPAAAPKPVRVLPAATARRVQATAPQRRDNSTAVAMPPVRSTSPAKAAPAAHKPAPVAQKQASPSKNGNGSHHTPASSNGDGPPSTEEFRTCLLNTVMQRTGYPVEMLDEELPLESGLGIDSIKTLEIFNALKDFHPYLKDEEDQEQEDLIADFAQLRTLGQIINAYDTKRMRFVHTHANGSASSNGSSNGAAAHELASKAPALPQGQRFALTATSSPVESHGDEKKNSSPDGTSSL